MKKIITMALAAIGVICNASNSPAMDNLIGCWQLFSESGERSLNYSKNYYSDGTFDVTERVMISSEEMDNHKVNRYTENVIQRGTWELTGDNNLIEKCQWGDKGDVKITFNVNNNILTEDFAYDEDPEKKYNQKFVKVGDLNSAPTEPHEIRIRHCGTIGTRDFNKIVFIIDGKRYANVDEFNNAIPVDVDQIECFYVNKSGDVYNYMTEEEIAAGKDTVFIVTLKK